MHAGMTTFWVDPEDRIRVKQDSDGYVLVDIEEITIWFKPAQRDKLQELRDALDEILVGVPTPPAEEIIGLTDTGEEA